MSVIMGIDTALETGAVFVAKNGHVAAFRTNSSQTDHAAWLHLAAKDVLGEASLTLSDLQAIAVSSGPGSYTGLRVGMAAAKGLCYAASLPLITETTLRLLTVRVLKAIQGEHFTGPVLICPMIDARRMEVFTATYNMEGGTVETPQAVVLEPDRFIDILEEHVVVFAGNGAVKWSAICGHANARFMNISYQIEDLAELAADKFRKGSFTDLAYSEPEYFKDVYTGK